MTDEPCGQDQAADQPLPPDAQAMKHTGIEDKLNSLTQAVERIENSIKSREVPIPKLLPAKPAGG